jgi:uncharacterized protein YjbI with pentapeptide repeats
MKKFSDKYINNYKDLAVMKVGYEFEFYASDISYYKVLELLNIKLDPVKVHGFRKYHSSFTPDDKNFKIEPDLSGGSNMIEIVTGPMDFFTSRHYLLKILNFIQNYGYTTEKCSLHINISFNSEKTNLELKDLNVLKHILKTDEDEIYSVFPSRENNIYAKSIKKLIPFEQYDFSNISIGTIQHNIKIPKDKYYGINFSNVFERPELRRLEYRYIGGKDYEKRSGEILELLSKFCLDVKNNIENEFDNDDITKLSEFLDGKISNFKNFINYDSFLVEFPNIHIQIDQQDHYDIVSSYYNKVYKKIYTLIEGTEGLDECIINYFTEQHKMEIIGAEFKSVLNLYNYDFIDCEIEDGIFDKCTFVSTDVNNAEIKRSKISNSHVSDSKLVNSNIETSTLKDSLFVNGYMNTSMTGGIFRSGKIGPYGTLSSTTKVVNSKDNFFSVGDEDDDEGMDKKKQDFKK